MSGTSGDCFIARLIYLIVKAQAGLLRKPLREAARYEIKSLLLFCLIDWDAESWLQIRRTEILRQ